MLGFLVDEHTGRVLLGVLFCVAMKQRPFGYLNISSLRRCLVLLCWRQRSSSLALNLMQALLILRTVQGRLQVTDRPSLTPCSHFLESILPRCDRTAGSTQLGRREEGNEEVGGDCSSLNFGTCSKALLDRGVFVIYEALKNHTAAATAHSDVVRACSCFPCR